MTTAATYGILTDILIWMSAALLIAVPAYAFLRRADPGHDWTGGGRVQVSAIKPQDALIALGLAALLWSAMVYGPYSIEKSALEATAAPEPAPASILLQSSQPEEAESSGISPYRMLSSQLQLTFLASMLFLYMTSYRGVKMSRYFSLSGAELGRATLIAGGTLAVSFVLMSFFAAGIEEWMEGFWPRGDQQETVRTIQENSARYSIWDSAILVLTIAVLAPLTEELLFRGFLYPVLKRYTDRWFAMILVSLFFAAIHMNIPAFTPLFLLAIGFTLSYEWTGSLWTPVIMHAMFNGSRLYLMLGAQGS